MSILKRSIAAVYWISLAAGTLMFFDIGRGDLSPWIWTQVAADAAKHGIGDALFVAYLYLVLYSGGFWLPFSILSRVFRARLRAMPNGDSRESNVTADAAALSISVAVFLTFLTFLHGIAAAGAAFIANTPQFPAVLVGWLIL